jgi:CDP-4-dehydro-6-deoxyglucose reductase, E1
MTDWWYPCAFSHWGDEETSAIFRVIASGRYTQGEEVEAFEEEFAAFHGMRHAIYCNSGSSANWLSVAALCHKQDNPLRRGDRVLVPAVAWATSYGPFVQHGMALHLADVGETWNANNVEWLRQGAKAGDGDLRAVLVCSILGNPYHRELFQQIAKGNNLYVIEDNCESIGAWWGPLGEKQFCGTTGHLNTFSFFYSHQLSAIEGGMVLTNDGELARLCRMLRDHGMTRFEKPQTFEDAYRFEVFGMNLRGVEMHAAIAREQLKKLETMRRSREANWNNWEIMCRGLPIQIPPKLRNAVRSPFGLNFTVENKDARRRLVAAFRAGGVDCRLPTGGSFLRHPYSGNWRGQQTPNADVIHDTGLFLGNAPFDLSDRMERAVKIMRETL